MAVLTRRTWANLRDEAIAVGGGHSHSGWSGRVEHWMYEAYLDLALSFHHHELEASATVTTADQALSATLPADVFVVHSLAWAYRAVAGQNGIAVQLKEMRLNNLLAQRETQRPALWRRYARQGATVQFDCPLDINQATTLTVLYYQVPAAPDFALTTSPATNWLWDSHLVEATVAKICGRSWTWDSSGMFLQTLQTWLQQQIQPNMNQEPMNNPPEKPTASTNQGGNQG